MPDYPQEPREYDVVLGGENPPPVNGAVLGGIEGVKAYSVRASAYIKLGEVTKAEFDFQTVKELEG